MFNFWLNTKVLGFYFFLTPSCVQELLLVLPSEITLDCSGDYMSFWNQTSFCHLQGKLPTCCSITAAWNTLLICTRAPNRPDGCCLPSTFSFLEYFKASQARAKNWVIFLLIISKHSLLHYAAGTIQIFWCKQMPSSHLKFKHSFCHLTTSQAESLICPHNVFWLMVDAHFDSTTRPLLGLSLSLLTLIQFLHQPGSISPGSCDWMWIVCSLILGGRCLA